MDELSCFSEASRQRAFERFEFLRAHLEEGRPLAAVAREAGLSYRTLQYWLERYRTSGLVALARKQRTDRGRRRKLSAALQEVIEGLALQKPPLPIRVVFNRTQLAAERLGEEPPSYDLVHDVVSHLPTDLVTLAHQGAKAYSNSFELVYRREAGCPNAIWQADHTPLDIELVQSGLDPKRMAKPWLTAVLDDYSRAVAGYFLSFASPCSLNTALALRQAIWRKEDPRWKVCGVPEVLYTDNGSDFTSRHLEQVSADLKIRLVFSTPGIPRGRGRIERFFSSVDQMFLCTLPGFKSSGGKERLTLAEFDVLFHKFIVETYHERPHGETGEPPSQGCNACRQCQYVGLCYGSPGVGKTLSARRYSLWDRIQGVKSRDIPDGQLQELARVDALLYTTPVVNTPREIERDIPKLRDVLRDLRQEPIRREETRKLKQIQKRDADHQDSFFSDYDWFSEKLPTLKPMFGQVCRKYSDKQRAIGDPTRLILVDEADRLKMASLEQMRAIFDAGGIGLVLIGMPGIEKRLAPYPQFYSRIGFVHEFRTLSPEQVRELLARHWRPASLTRPSPIKAALDAETVAAVIRVTGGNFRLLGRLLTQAERILEINGLTRMTAEVIDAARESLVIGQL